MTKLLRKYQKIILIIGGSLLMVVFLVEGALSRCGNDPNRAVIMVVNGRKVRSPEFREAMRERQILEGFFVLANPQDRTFFSRSLGIEGNEHWYLLSMEAKRAGLVGGPQDGRGWIPTLAEEVVRARYSLVAAQYLQTPEGQQAIRDTAAGMDFARSQLAMSSGEDPGRAAFTEEDVDQALATFRGVYRMREQYINAFARVSDRRVMLEADRILPSAHIDYIFVPSMRLISQMPEPTEEELATHFAEYREKKATESDNGVGYVQPPRVKVSYVKLDRMLLFTVVQPTLVEVYDRFLENNPSGTREQFEEVRAALQREIQAQKVEQVLDAATRVISAEVAKKVARLPKRDDYFVLPADWDRIGPKWPEIIDTVVQRVQSEVGVTIPAPEIKTLDTKWQNRFDLSSEPGIGSAAVTIGTQRANFPTYALSVREIAGDNVSRLQVGVPSQMLIDAAGDRYFFTVLDARKEGPADSMEEIREVVVNTKKSLDAFEVLKREAEEYKSRAVAAGLEALTEVGLDPSSELNKNPLIVQKNLTVARTGTKPQDQVITVDTFLDTLVDEASKLDPLVPPESIELAQRIHAIPIPERLGLAVVKINGYTPATDQLFNQREAVVVARLQNEAFMLAQDTPFSYERMKAKYKVVFPGRRGTTADASTDPTS